MPFNRDPRYDVLLIDSPDGSTAVETIPLVLRESGGALDFNVSLTSPFGGRVTEDDLEDKDNSRFQVYTQRDWRGGLGQEHTYEDPAAFLSGVMDTRFRNSLLLPPATNQVQIAGSSDPQFTPDTAGVATGSKTVTAGWTKRNTTDGESEANAVWTQAQYQYIQPSNFSSIGFGVGLGRSGIGKKITIGDAGFTITKLEVWLARSFAATGEVVSVNIYADSAGLPGTLLWGSTIADTSISLYGGWSVPEFAPSLAVSANTSYWIVCYYAGTTNRFDWRSSNADGFETVATYSGSWSTMTDQKLNYRINAGANIDFAKTRVQIAQSFVATAISATQLQIPIRASAWGTSPTVEMYLCSDTGGNPNIGSPLKTATVTNPGTSTAWVTLTFTSQALTNGVTYWIVLSVDASASAHTTRVQWLKDPGAAYASGAPKTHAYAAGAWGAWTADAGGGDYYFIIQTLAAANPYFYTHTFAATAYSVWVTPASGVTLTSVRVFVQLTNWAGAAGLTLYVRSDSSNVPGSSVQSATITQASLAGLTTAAGWLQVNISTSLTGSTKYHLTIEPTAPAPGDAVSLAWSCDTGGGVWAGQGSEGVSSTLSGAALTWTGAKAHDFYFILNNGSVAAANFAVQPVRFAGKWYAAAGVGVYRYNTSTSKFDVVYSAAAAVTSLAGFAGKIYAALGDSNDMVESSSGDSGAWAATSGTRRYTYLRAYNGYMYAVKAAGGASALIYFNGTTWATALTVGSSDLTITGLVGFRNEIMVLTSRGIFSLSSDFVYQVVDLTNDEDGDNGKNSLTWMLDGKMYVPVRAGLNAYDGVQMAAAGPDLEEGLPAGQQGRIVAMAGTKSWLFAAIDAGAAGTSSILAFNGQGWHCLVLGSAVGRRIRAIGIETVTGTTPRLWYFEDATPYYVELPTLSDNPNQISGMRYAPTGTLTSSKIGGRLALIAKDFHSISVWAEGCTANQTVAVYYEVDNAGIWTLAGTVTSSPYTEIRLAQSSFVAKTTAVGCTATVINVASGDSLSDLQAGEFVRIGAEVAQVSVVNSTTQFTLAVPLSAAPLVGVRIYPSGPAGRQIRYRLVLSTTSATASPRVIRVSIRMQGQMLAKARISFTPRIEDGMSCRTGVPYTLSASVLRSTLYTWVQRVKSFYLVDPMGRNWIVKPASASETMVVRQDEGAGMVAQRLRSAMRIEVDEA
jgi:hypothetical protein